MIFSVDLAALDRRVAPEVMPDRLGECVRAVDDKRGPAGSRPRSISRRSMPAQHCARLPPTVSSSGCLKASLSIPSAATSTMLTDVDAVDLHHHDVEAGRIRTHPFRAQPTTPRSAAKLPTSTAGTSPSGSRAARRNFRVDTSISIRFIAHLPSQSSATASSQLGSASSWSPTSRTRGRSLPPCRCGSRVLI
jgi:hypothetical protein